MWTSQFKMQLLRSVRRMLGAPEPKLQAAVLPWRKKGGMIEIMLITSRGTGRWILPKGWPEKGEALHEAAMREAAEEAGVYGIAANEPIGCYHYDKALENGAIQSFQVHVFAMQVKEQRKNWPERAHRDRIWVKPDVASTMVAMVDLGKLIADFSGKPQQGAG